MICSLLPCPVLYSQFSDHACFNCCQQCDFFHWADELYPTGDKHLDDLNEISRECKRLKERIDLIQEEHNNERAAWNREREEIMSQLSSVKAELDQFKTRIKTLNESDLMPPYDDGALVIQTV